MTKTLLLPLNSRGMFKALIALSENQLWKLFYPGFFSALLIALSGSLQAQPYYPAEAKNPQNQTNANGIWYYTANAATECIEYASGNPEDGCIEYKYSFELWRSNGTPQGTIKIEEYEYLGISEESFTSYPDAFEAVGSSLFYIGRRAFEYYVLTRIANNSTVPVEVAVIEPGVYGEEALNYNYNFTAVNNTLYFTTADGGFSGDQYGKELWKSDGTTAGTGMVKDIYPGPSGSDPTELRNENGFLYFLANNGSGAKLWKSDGTAEGTAATTTPYYPAGVKNPVNVAFVNGMVYFKANAKEECIYTNDNVCLTKDESFELWRSNGTPQGTVKIQEITNYTYSEQSFKKYPDAFKAVGNTLFYVGRRGEAWYTLNKIDNSSTVPVELKFIELTFSVENIDENYNYNFTAVNNTLFFTTSNVTDGDNGKELWKSNGTVAGTVLVKDIYPGEISSDPSDLRNENGVLYFLANDASGRKLWKSDGTTQGTVPVDGTPGYSTCSASGTILWEKWTNISGTSVSAIPLTTPAASISQINSFEAPFYSAGNNYGQRIRGYLCVPATASYTFYITGDDNCELYLSTDEDPSKKVRIAHITGTGSASWAARGQWTKFASQKSAAITLQANKQYYIEALHKESLGGDHLSVGWHTSPTTPIIIIPGSSLSPFVPAEGYVFRGKWTNIPGIAVSDIPLNTSAQSFIKLTSFEAPSGDGSNYGQRITGYVHPVVSGSYTFYIAGDDNCELYLSTDEDPSKKVRIAHITGTGSASWAAARQWTKFASQKSVAISLQAGRKYYIEALHKESLGGDNLAVGWILPFTSTINVIPGSSLSPYRPASPERLAAEELTEGFTSQVFPNPFDDKLTIQTQAQGALQVSLLDALGRTFYQATHPSTGVELVIDLSKAGLKTGMYLLQLQTSDGKRHITRIVKK